MRMVAVQNLKPGDIIDAEPIVQAGDYVLGRDVHVDAIIVAAECLYFDVESVCFNDDLVMVYAHPHNLVSPKDVLVPVH